MATVIHKELLYHICEVLGGRDQIGMIYCAFSLQLVIFMYSAGTLPLCIWDFEKKLKKGDNLIFTAFGEIGRASCRERV